ncbi:MAG TPA: MBL fold metallo-hydrolase [Candidatus Limnocylindrales bacterium]|nr:MBL fold metallo-hydrolase [Candidatus Limnocylindrales bacterium]
MPHHAADWVEIADRVFTKRYVFFDQEIGVVLGDGEALVIDTRVTEVQGRVMRDEIRELTPNPVTLVVNTHWHHDHTFGNHVFRPAVIWGHERCAPGMREHGERMRAELASSIPELAEAVAAVTIEPPERSFSEHARIHVGGRLVELRYLGRAHTDADIVVEVPDAGVLFAGDILEDGATPYFGDGYPLDWPETALRLAARVRGPVVPGHGAIRDRAFADEQAAAIGEIARLAREVRADRLSLDEAIAASPFAPATSREPLERALRQLRGELD